MTAGDLAVTDDCGVVFVVETYTGCYGRPMVNAVRADASITLESALWYWTAPLAYFEDELSIITEERIDR